MIALLAVLAIAEPHVLIVQPPYRRPAVTQFDSEQACERVRRRVVDALERRLRRELRNRRSTVVEPACMPGPIGSGGPGG